ncbi:hypothetical protein V8G54_021127 [Vigna mungo]|uniref:AAA+ ATPase domain-containing protein n=1 Tax=Vigna mungo TaxID=3915 RepID=A0AAQ3NDS1_VIGMU
MDPIVSTATESALNITASVVKRQVGYFFNYKDKIRELESYIEKLEHNKERLQHQVDNALWSAEEIEKDVQRCLTLMDDKIKEYKSYINNECHAKTICSFGFFPNNFRLRYQLGRKATKMVKEIIGDELWKTSFDNVSYQEFPSIDATFSNNGYESFGSRTKTMEMIMKALQDSTVGLIGVYGPGGVGKTTLVKEIARKALEKKLFKIVIIANITGNPDLKKIQEQIAGMLGMKLEGESEIARVDRIRKRLKNGKENTLIILDDLWGGLDFNKLGIPCNDDASQQEVIDMSDFGSNISDFGYNKTEMKELSKVDLDKMEKEKLSNDYRRGKILLISRNKQVLCNEMDVQQSSIFSVGVLDEKESETLLKKVVGVKNSEFDKNATEIAKWSAGLSVFSYTARMGNDGLIMDLVKFCVGLNLLPGVHTITNARKRVKEIIQELEESSLLVKSYSIDRFNMHDIVRDVALSILSKEKHVLYMKNAVLDEWPHENDFERYSAIFLHFCDINDELPESIHCPRLEVLHIDNKNESFEIPDQLFKSMVRLRVLVLAGSNIENLPLEFGQLDKLQFLDLSNCLKLRQIAFNIIPRMGILEEFYIRDNSIIWEAEENMKSENASLSELNSYKIVIGEFNLLNLLTVGEGVDIHSEKWIKMLFKTVERLLLGELNDVQDIFFELNIEGFPNLKHLFIVNNFGINYIINPRERFHSFVAFPKLESIWLYKLDNLEIICDNNLVETSFCNLKVIKIQTCIKLVNLFLFSMVKLLTMLETIEVCDYDSLKEIVSKESQIHTISYDKIEFSQLRLLTLKYLPTFIYLYSVDKIRGSAHSLQDQVFQQRNKDIVVDVEHKVTNSCLPLFNEKVSTPKLEWLELSSINIHKIWSDQCNHGFQNLLTLNVTDCGNLKYLLSFSMAESLVNLQSIFISECAMMEDIFCPEDAKYIDVFPKLKKMEIMCMEKLCTIWKSDIGLHSFSNLNSLLIRECNELVTIFPNYMGQRLQSVQSLTVTDCELVENIFDFANIFHTSNIIEANLGNIFLKNLPSLVNVWKGNTGEIFKCNNLQSIRVDESPKLKYIFPVSIANDLGKLEVLEVWYCWAMTEIIGLDKHSSETAITFKFPHLNTISLIELHELRSFYSGIHTLEWPPLKKLEIVDCSMLEGLTSEITNSKEQPIVLATKKVSFEYSNDINLVDYPEGKVRHGKFAFPDNFFGCLKKLEFDEACKRDTLIPSYVLPYLKNLEELNVEKCESAQIIFDIHESEIQTYGIMFRLENLTLKHLSNLKCVWKENIKGIVSFSNLQRVDVDGCGSLLTLFPLSLAKNLGKLKKLHIQGCEKMVEIVGREDKMEHRTTLMFEFPCLSYLYLENMPLLSCFYPGKHHLECPLLDELYVECCPKLKLFRSSFHNDGKKKILEAPTNLQQPLFTIEKVSPKLEGLTLNEENIKLMSDARLPQDLLCKLKYLILFFEDDNNGKDSLPFDFFHKLPNLEWLTVQKCFGLKEIFPSQKLQVHDKVLAGLKQLYLLELKELECIGLEHRWVQPYTEKLELLKLYKCPLARSSLSIAFCQHSFFIACLKEEGIRIDDNVVVMEHIYLSGGLPMRELRRKGAGSGFGACTGSSSKELS